MRRFIYLAIILFTPVFAQASVVNLTFLSTTDNTQHGFSFVDNVSTGDLFSVVLALDNGNSSLFSQTWSAADILTVTFDFGSGNHTTVFDPNGGDGLSTSVGDFATDGLGNLTQVPSTWTDENLINVVSTNSSQTPDAWFLNNLNDKYYTDNFSFAVGIPNSNDNTLIANWDISAAAVSVPTPPTVLLLITAGMVGWLSKLRQKI